MPESGVISLAFKLDDEYEYLAQRTEPFALETVLPPLVLSALIRRRDYALASGDLSFTA